MAKRIQPPVAEATGPVPTGPIKDAVPIDPNWVTQVTATETLTECPLCGDDNITDFMTDIRTERPTTIWNLCENCGHVFVSPRPTQKWLTDYYTMGYRRDIFRIEEDAETIPQRSVAEETQRAIRLSHLILRSTAQVNRHLDIGSSTGVLIASVLDRMNPKEAFGVEPNEAWRAFGESAFERRVESVDLQEVSDTPVTFYADLSQVPKTPKFDLITSIHTLEHMRNPVGTLRKLKRMLTTTGTIIVETPFLYGGMVNPLMWPHMHCFTQDTIRILLEAVGFHITMLETNGSAAPFWPSPQHMTVVAQPKPLTNSLRDVLGRFNRYRNHVGFVQNQAAGAQTQYRMG